MKRLLILLLLAFDAAAMPAQVIRVIDGDTLEIDGGMWVIVGAEARQMRAPVSVRVVGVDTPELRASQECERIMAQKAKEFVVSWIADGKVELVIFGLDKYAGRIDARVMRGDVSLADALIAAGLGRAYSAGARGAWC